MRRARRRLAAIGTVGVLALTWQPVVAAPPASSQAPRAAKPRAFLIHLLDGADPIVVDKYVEEGGEVRFEKYGGWVGIPRYEVLRIVPDESEELTATPAAGDGPVEDTGETALYVTTRSGASVRASTVGTAGSEVRVTTPEGSLTFHRGDLVGVLRVPAPPAPPEAWITLWGVDDGGARPGRSGAGPDPGEGPPQALTDRPHLLQLASGVVIQVDGFWLEAGEIRFRRLGGVVGFALGEIARLLPQEVGPFRGRLPVRFVRRLAPDQVEVRLRDGGLRRVRLIGVEAVPGEAPPENPWDALEPDLPVHLEFDRERYGPAGEWLAYVYLPSGRMLNVELIRVGLARPRAEPRNLRYLDVFEEVWTRSPRGRPPSGG
jgi:hypothetical protein